MKWSATFALVLFLLLLLSPAMNVLAEKKKKLKKVVGHPCSSPNPAPWLPESPATPTPSPSQAAPAPSPSLLPDSQTSPTLSPSEAAPTPMPALPSIPGSNIFVDSCEGVDCTWVCKQYDLILGEGCKTYQGYSYCNCLVY